MKKWFARFLVGLFLMVQGVSFGFVYGENPWSFKDDRALLENVNESGRTDWKAVSKKIFFEEYSPEECEARYRYLRDAFSRKWTKESKNLLYRRVAIGGNSWEDVANDFGLPIIVVWSKYKEIAPEYQKLKAKNFNKRCVWLPKNLWVKDHCDSESSD